jgi:hypothetical protein
MTEPAEVPAQEEHVDRPGVGPLIWMPVLTAALAGLVVLVGWYTFVA